ncbi:hypothetical protein PCASD_26276 [Puccinia coronata f. sp. avenae]|uniref:Uncharacterized protein n=1 Tax=Puccinia coronata f. sp. avenae TaxID=200324 RepID=A0A2N5TH49_9BASI|nr:hypothetical protein PCASD_26276 [Puccinia coronata f. sp. avenae]
MAESWSSKAPKKINLYDLPASTAGDAPATASSLLKSTGIALLKAPGTDLINYLDWSFVL